MPDERKLHDFLEEAKRDYRISLTQLLQEVEELILQLVTDPSDRSGRECLLETIHRVRGSAGSFGLDEVSKIAAEWEIAVRDLPPIPPPSSYAGMRKHLNRIRNLIS